MLTAVLLGLALGVRHAFDPDHIAAVSAIAARERSPRSAAWIGASWGLGHSATVCVVGGAIIALRIAIPAGVTLLLELAVGLVLVGLGVANLAASAPAARAAPAAAATSRRPMGPALTRSILVGLAHGLAGSAAVALLALAAVPTPAAALVYLLVFGVGNVAAMIGFSALVGAPAALLGRDARVQRVLAAGTGALSLVLGCLIVYEIGSVGRAVALG